VRSRARKDLVVLDIISGEWMGLLLQEMGGGEGVGKDSGQKGREEPRGVKSERLNRQKSQK